MKIAVIGGGAAGFFAAISAKTHYPKAHVTLLEKTNKVLSKVKISGGGRCNVTNGCETTKELISGYPRGGRKLKKAFQLFDNKDTISWFESRGVRLKTESDGRVFPVSNDSQSIVDCLMKEINKLGIDLELKKGVRAIIPFSETNSSSDKITLKFTDKNLLPEKYDRIILATGGSPKRNNLEWIEKLGHDIVDPIPSLFTFNMPKESITELMGVVAQNTQVTIQGSKLKSSGPLLITHWGMSGPAILKLSAFGARPLFDLEYSFKIKVNWISIQNNEDILNTLLLLQSEHSKKKLSNIKPYKLVDRLWLFLLNKIEISPNKKWGELGQKSMNKLINIFTNDIFQVLGKTTFKEEFVTCGGVSLDHIDLTTMESQVCRGIYFAGELLNIDGITGGYNFQAAWTTGYISGRMVGKSPNY